MQNSKTDNKASGKENKKDNSNVIKISNDHKWYYKHGIFHASQNRYRRALLYIRRAYELKPGNTEYAFNLAGILAILKDYNKSNKCLMGMLSSKKQDSVGYCYFGLGCNYFDMGKYSIAARYFEKFLRIDTDSPFKFEACKVMFYLRTEGLIPIKNEWNDVILTAISKREISYGFDYPEVIEWMWLHFIYIIMEGKSPIIRSVNIWAAFIEFLYCSLNDCDFSNNDIAAKYGLTGAKLNRKISDVMKKIRI